MIYRLAQKLRSIYWRILKPVTHGVKAAVFNEAGKILLVQMSYQNGWALPGGGVKRNENPLHALKREIHEELGIEIKDLEKLAVFENNAEGKIDTIELISCKASGQLHPNGEISKAEWFDLEHLPDMTPATARRLKEFKEKRFSQTW